MILTKKALPRRTFLRGMGVTLALPLLDAMVPALSTATSVAAKPLRRLGFVYIPNGANMEQWTPPNAGTRLSLSPSLSPLEPFRDHVTVVSGLGNRPADSWGEGGGDHSRGPAAWLSAAHPKKTEGADIRAGITIDQIAAQAFSDDTPRASLELATEPTNLVGHCGGAGYSCAYVNTLSWRTPTTPLPMENNPRVVFEQLFGDGASRTERRTQRQETRSILDAVTQELAHFRGVIGPSDRIRIEEYLDAIRETERQIQLTEARGELDLVLPERPTGIPDTLDAHCKLMFDLQVLAYQADITRVITFYMLREISQQTYVEIGVPDPHHSISHHQDDPEKLVKLAKINTYHIHLLAYYLDKLHATSDGDGSLLDHSLILYGGGMSNGNTHSHSPLPLLLAGGAAGRLSGGRHLQHPEGTPLANLLVSILDAVNVPCDRIGDSTGRLAL